MEAKNRIAKYSQNSRAADGQHFVNLVGRVGIVVLASGPFVPKTEFCPAYGTLLMGLKQQALDSASQELRRLT
jgi:hypothetical protein